MNGCVQWNPFTLKISFYALIYLTKIIFCLRTYSKQSDRDRPKEKNLFFTFLTHYLQLKNLFRYTHFLKSAKDVPIK